VYALYVRTAGAREIVRPATLDRVLLAGPSTSPLDGAAGQCQCG